jgi:polyisoprenoid-binding protein YceI
MKNLSTSFLSLGAAAVLLALPAGAQPAAALNPAQSEVSFTIKQMGVPVDGRFKKFDAQIALDPKKPETGKVAFNIDVGSATMGVAEADAELPKPVWFDAAKHPKASFASSSVKALGGGRFEVAGKLSIKGATRDIVVPVAIQQNGATSIANGSFTIKRLDFKVGDGEWADTSMVANDVQVKFKLSLGGLAPL